MSFIQLNGGVLVNLKRSTPEKQGISSSAILSFLESVEKSEIELHSFMIARNGEVVSEGAWHPYEIENKHFMFSFTKSVTATAIGFALSENLLSLDDKVISFFPEYKNCDVSEKMKSMTVEHLLTMTSGYIENISGSTQWSRKEGSWVKQFLELPLTYEPGTRFVYNSGSSHMLSAIISKVTSQSTLEYLQPRLFTPLQINDVIWDTDPYGNNTGGWGIRLAIEDVTKFGQFYLQKGYWNGEQLLDKEWFERATSFKVSNAEMYDEKDRQQGYGYQFWMIRNGGYRAAGKFGQLCIILPQQNAVLSFTAGTDQSQNLLDLVWKHIYPNFEQNALENNLETQEKLNKFLEELKVHKPQPFSISPIEPKISGKLFCLEENIDDIQSIQLFFERGMCVFQLKDKKGEHEIKCGLGEWVESNTTMPGAILHHMQQPDDLVVKARGNWLDESTFFMTWTYTQLPFSDFVSCNFEENKVIYRRSVNVNGDVTSRPTILGRQSI